MGKNLKGKELGKGISQRKDGLYIARFTNKHGKRIQKYFKSLQESRKWLAESAARDKLFDLDDEITVKEWCEIWKEHKERSVRPSSYEAILWVYDIVLDKIGCMKMANVKPIHIQELLYSLGEDGFKNSSIRQVRTITHNIFEYAIQNDVVNKNPVISGMNCKIGDGPSKKEAMTIEEQIAFTNAIKGTRYENDFLFILETGIRYGELVGLKWSDIDLKNKYVDISRTVQKLSDGWHTGPCKSQSSMRRIPLSKKAVNIIRNQMISNRQINIDEVGERSEYVFAGIHGRPVTNYGYNQALKKIREKIGIESMLTMHILRHTFATRCIECGMKPKTLQSILGHSNITVTMDIYVHSTEDNKQEELENVSLKLAKKLV